MSDEDEKLKALEVFTPAQIAECLELLAFFSINTACPKCGVQEMSTDLLDKIDYYDSNFFVCFDH